MIFYWMLLSLFSFSVGIYGVLTRRNAVGILISVELMLNAAALNFVIFNRFLAPTQVDGQIMAIFVMGVAAAELLMGMAILLMLFRKKQSVDVTRLHALRH
ncbi:NADH-quinone oxidoreductase subunit NuoK [Bdellovibrionota bacterium FG-1]